MSTEAFFAAHPVFSLEQAAAALAPPGGRAAVAERLKHHAATGRIQRIARGLYAAAPPGGPPPDPFLVAHAARPAGIFCYHSALQLLGAAHSVWSQHALFTDQRRPPMKLDGAEIRFLRHPAPLREREALALGVRRAERQGRLLPVTGPERTLVEGFRHPARCGGIAEFVESAAGFPVLDLDLLETVLEHYATANLWAAAGWFLQRFQQTFHVSGAYLSRLEARRPQTAQYLVRGVRGGVLDRRWNLILPPETETLEEPDET